MKNKYYSGLIVSLAILIVFLVGLGFCVAKGLFWIVLVFALGSTFSIYSLYYYLVRSNRDTLRLIDAITVGDAISFQSFHGKGLDPEVGAKLEQAINIFEERGRNIKAREIFYDILLSRIDTPILLTDENHQIKWINNAASSLFGVDNPKSLDDLKYLSPECLSVFKQLKTKEVKSIKINKKGEETTLAITMSYMIISGLKQKLISLKDIQKPLEENESEAWKKLIRILTHEMMNSLTPIISLAETFSDNTRDNDPLMMDKAMQTIFRRSRGLVDFVSDYQRLTRIPLPLKSSIKATSLLESISQLLEANNIRFSSKIDPSDLLINADQTQLEQVLINLIKNAWEATSQDENAKVEVSIYMDFEQSMIINITDNGCGISPVTEENIFIPFFTTKEKGSGIGLSICRQIINNHDGSIMIKSVEGKGTNVIVRL